MNILRILPAVRHQPAAAAQELLGDTGHPDVGCFLLLRRRDRLSAAPGLRPDGVTPERGPARIPPLQPPRLLRL